MHKCWMFAELGCFILMAIINFGVEETLMCCMCIFVRERLIGHCTFQKRCFHLPKDHKSETATACLDIKMEQLNFLRGLEQKDLPSGIM